MENDKKVSEPTKERTNQNQVIGAVVVVVVVVFIGIYWFAIRPNNERAACNTSALNQARADGAESYTNTEILSSRNVVFQNYNQAYLTCLNSKGL